MEVKIYSAEDINREIRDWDNQDPKLIGNVTRFVLASDYDKLAKENKELMGLLRVAICPNCDGSGAIKIRGREIVTREMAMDAGCPEMEGSLYCEEEIEQCQWCDERNNFTSKGA
jgi:hypothetical protein